MALDSVDRGTVGRTLAPGDGHDRPRPGRASASVTFRPTPPRRTDTRLLLASTGGHLAELELLARRLEPRAGREVWVTFDAAQSRKLAADGREVEFVRETPPRDLRNVLRNFGPATRLLRRHRPQDVVTTGAGIALSFLPVARALRVPSHYIESAARIDAPSLTGKLIARVPGVRLYAQHPGALGDAWHFSGSVFDQFAVTSSAETRPLHHVLVTVGSLDFSFRRLVARLEDVLPPGVEATLQLGVDAAAMPAAPGRRIVERLAPDDLQHELETADVIVAHAGIGSALAALRLGKMPVLVPRLHRHGEHVDDHQLETALALSGRGVAVAADADELSLAHLQTAAAARVAAQSSPPFLLR